MNDTVTRIPVPGYDGIARVPDDGNTYYVTLPSTEGEKRCRSWSAALSYFERNGGARVEMNTPRRGRNRIRDRSRERSRSRSRSRAAESSDPVRRIRTTKKRDHVSLATTVISEVVPIPGVLGGEVVANTDGGLTFGDAENYNDPFHLGMALSDDLTWINDAQLSQEVERRNRIRLLNAAKCVEGILQSTDDADAKCVLSASGWNYQRWGAEEDDRLIMGVASHGDDVPLRGDRTGRSKGSTAAWNRIASIVGTRGARQCRRRWDHIDPSYSDHMLKMRYRIAAARATRRQAKISQHKHLKNIEDLAAASEPAPTPLEALADCNIDSVLAELVSEPAFETSTITRSGLDLGTSEMLPDEDDIMDVRCTNVSTAGEFSFGAALGDSFSFAFVDTPTKTLAALKKNKITDYLQVHKHYIEKGMKTNAAGAKFEAVCA